MSRLPLRSAVVVLATALLVSAPPALPQSRPASSTIKKRIAEYFRADADRRAELREFFASVPPLSKRDAALFTSPGSPRHRYHPAISSSRSATYA